MEAVLAEVMKDTVQAGVDDLAERRDRFVAEHLRRIFVQIYRMVGNVADAQDLTQETFIKALQREDQLRDEQKAAHWLSRIATNTAIDFLRRHGRVTFTEIDPSLESDAESPEAATSRIHEARSRRKGAEERIMRGMSSKKA